MHRLAFLLALLPALVLAQPAPSGGCPVNATCRARQFTLLAGNRLCLNGTTCTSRISASASTGGVLFNSGAADSGTNIAYALDTNNLLSGGTELLRISNQGSARLILYNSGAMFTQGYIQTNSTLFVGSPGVVAGQSVVPLYLVGSMANGATAIGAVVNTPAYSTSGAKLISLQNNNIEKAAFSLDGKAIFDATDSSGTPGAATINKPSGISAVAAAASSVVITNSTVTASSICFAQLRANDGTCTGVRSVVPAAGSFTMNTNAACTGNTAFSWVCFN